jgi:hypothetical protein
MNYKPEIGEICLYFGRKKSIHGKLVECVKHFRDAGRSSVFIRGYNTNTKYDKITWSCWDDYLEPANREPDWEI